MSIDMFLDSADQQVDAISSQCRTYITGLEDVKTAIAQFAIEDSLQGKTYDSAKNYLTTTFIPLANGIILICESLEKAAKSFPKSYRNEVDSISLQEEILRNQINRLTILAQNIENIENALKATPLSPLLKHFSETLQNSKQEVQKQLVKLLSFDPVSGQLFIEVEGLIDNVERGLKEVNSGKSFNASTGTFSTMGLNMDWIKPINQQWEIYAESKEQLDTFEIKVTKTQYGTFYQVLRNGQVDDELSSAYQMAAIKSDIKTLLHLGGEFVLVNDIYRLVNGKDWLSGEEENRAEAAGWLTLSALPVSKLAQIAKELKAGNRALKGVALSEKDLEALSKAGVFKDTSGVGKKAKKASGATGTVWDDIKGTQPPREGTTIPKSFEINANGEKLWVNPNGTKHMVEYSTRNLSHGQKLTEQQLLRSFQGAVEQATSTGIKFDTKIIIDNWELIFSPAREAGQLPVIKHAVYLP
ncbi:T7SS effector LXG polymorphic toxin [Listeria welshimeri]|uniref:T7SS effector LXG polymorphic toxin n=1 Tax=Listeria welshimeri TaxID=1643 RepID=UPI001887E31A|nr:T7SS effector LXG polymorphic toxin [Listeria welshimeri]MBF2427388.1 transposase [Listeria welshimeri]